jgi:hypothetical protein
VNHCAIGRSLGIERCGTANVPGYDSCDKHEPSRAEQRRQQASEAAKRSHAARLQPLKLGPEFDAPDLSTPTSRTSLRAAVMSARRRGDIDDKAAGTLLAAIEGAMRDDRATRGPRGSGAGAPPAPLVVEIPQYTNGQHVEAEASRD